MVKHRFAEKLEFTDRLDVAAYLKTHQIATKPNTMRTARNALMILAATLAPLLTHAWPWSERLWTIQIRNAGTQSTQETKLHYDWGSISHFNFRGKGPAAGNATITTSDPVPSEPLNINWTDKSGKYHKLEIPVNKLIGNKNIFGRAAGGVSVLINDSLLTVELTIENVKYIDGKRELEYITEVVFTNKE